MAFQESVYHPYDFANRRHIWPSLSEIARRRKRGDALCSVRNLLPSRPSPVLSAPWKVVAVPEDIVSDDAEQEGSLFFSSVSIDEFKGTFRLLFKKDSACGALSQEAWLLYQKIESTAQTIRDITIDHDRKDVGFLKLKGVALQVLVGTAPDPSAAIAELDRFRREELQVLLKLFIDRYTRSNMIIMTIVACLVSVVLLTMMYLQKEIVYFAEHFIVREFGTDSTMSANSIGLTSIYFAMAFCLGLLDFVLAKYLQPLLPPVVLTWRTIVTSAGFAYRPFNASLMDQ